MSKRDRIHQVMAAALGDASVLAVRELEQMVSIKEAHITKHALPVILRHLNRHNMIPFETSDWSSSPKILNALSCFGMITSAFRQCSAASVPPMERVYEELTDPLWPLIVNWSLYFIRRTRILENDENALRDIEVIMSLERVIHALTTWKDVAKRYLMPNADNDEFLQILASLWIVCMGSSRALSGDLTHVLSMVISGEASPGRVGPITEAFQSEPPCVVSRAVLWSDVFPQLVENGVVSWLTQLARRMTSRRTPPRNPSLLIKCVLRLFSTIHNLMIFGYKAIFRAVQAHVLEAALRAEACFTRLGAIEGDDADSLMQLCQEIIDGVIHYLIYRSVVTAARKDIARIEKNRILARIDPNRRFLQKWQIFTDSVASQHKQNSVFKSVMLSTEFIGRMATSRTAAQRHVSDIHINILKGKIAKDAAWNSQSEFDESKDKTQFRKYEEACERVKKFYLEQHEKQTMDFNIRARVEFRKHVRARMGIWEAMEKLNTLVDDSDPDTDVSQIEHLLQTAEAIRRDGKPEWMQVVGLVHDLGKLLYIFGSEGQWDVVGDTFVVGCQFSDKIIYPGSFANNPDSSDAIYSTEYGVYKPHCGLENVMLSWGHDEYLYHVLKDQSSLPDEALAMIRYHSFYPWHREGAYAHLTNASDEKALTAVRAFNPYDLYSKSDEPVDPAKLKPYYQSLIEIFFPEVIEW
ncbi:putative myo-inositol oxygenase [Mucidula mucida]|nr:putative myo-inositol oxygenase [Mucidula mucida]